MKRILLLLFVLVLINFHTKTKAQVTRGLWEYGPVVTTTNNFYGWFAENIKAVGFGFAGEDGVKFWNNNRWWIPSFRSKLEVLKQIDSPNDDINVKWWDWGFRNVCIGYHAGYLSYIYPIGFDIQIDYEKQNWKLKNSRQDGYSSYDKQMIVPALLLKTRIGDYTEKKYNVIFEAGAKYNYAFRAKGEYCDVESVNNGVTGVLGLGVINSYTHFALQLRYEHDFFDYFNQDYSPHVAFQAYPYNGVSTKHGALNIFISFGF